MNPDTTNCPVCQGLKVTCKYCIKKKLDEKTNEVERLQAETDRLYIVAQEASESAQRKTNEVARLRELCKEIITELEKAHFHNPISAQFLAEKYNIELDQLTK